MNKEKIDYRFKIIYAFAILMVISGHAEGGGLNLFYEWFPPGGMHLMLFVFSSGYFFNNESLNNTKAYLLHKLKKIILPLYLYNFIYGLFTLFMKSRGFIYGDNFDLNNLLISPITNGLHFGYNMGSWFLAPLFFVQIFNLYFRKLLKKYKLNEYIYFMIYLLLGMLGIYLASHDYRYGFYLTLVRSLIFLPFYALGILYKNNLEKYDQKISHLYYFGIIFLIKMLLIFFLLKNPTYTLSWCNDFIDGPIIPFLNGFLGIFFWFRIAKILEPSIGKDKYLNVIADHTFSIMMNHLTGFFILKGIFVLMVKYLNIFTDFDFNAYKINNILYIYLPHNTWHISILYVISGIIFSLFIDYIIKKIKTIIKNGI